MGPKCERRLIARQVAKQISQSTRIYSFVSVTRLLLGKIVDIIGIERGTMLRQFNTFSSILNDRKLHFVKHLNL